MDKQSYIYSAYTAHNDGNTFVHVGTLANTMRKAKSYAKKAFPKGQRVTCAVQVSDKSSDRVTEVITV